MVVSSQLGVGATIATFCSSAVVFVLPALAIEAGGSVRRVVWSAHVPVDAAVIEKASV